MEPGIQWANNGPFYHGTSVPLHGNRLVPATTHGGYSIWGDTGAEAGQPSRDHAFSTTSEDTAWAFANHSRKNQGGRAYVAQVEPEDPSQIRPGYYNSLSEYIAPSYKVVGRYDVKPGHQATVPDVDWNEYSTDEYQDANHPPPHEHRLGEDDVRVPGRVSAFQMDLFTGKTAGHHSAAYVQGIDNSRLGAYHRNALRGYYPDRNKRR